MCTGVDAVGVDGRKMDLGVVGLAGAVCFVGGIRSGGTVNSLSWLWCFTLEVPS